MSNFMIDFDELEQIGIEFVPLEHAMASSFIQFTMPFSTKMFRQLSAPQISSQDGVSPGAAVTLCGFLHCACLFKSLFVDALTIIIEHDSKSADPNYWARAADLFSGVDKSLSSAFGAGDDVNRATQALFFSQAVNPLGFYTTILGTLASGGETPMVLELQDKLKARVQVIENFLDYRSGVFKAESIPPAREFKDENYDIQAYKTSVTKARAWIQANAPECNVAKRISRIYLQDSPQLIGFINEAPYHYMLVMASDFASIPAVEKKVESFFNEVFNS